MDSKGTQPYIYMDEWIYVSILPEIPLPSRLPHNTEFPVLYTRSLLVIHFKYGSVYMLIPNSLTIPSPQQA